MLRLPLVLVSAIFGMMIVVGLAYGLPQDPGAKGGGTEQIRTRPVGMLAVLRLPGVQRGVEAFPRSAEGDLRLGALEGLFKHFGGGGGPIASTPINEELKKPEGPPILPGSEREQKRLTEILLPEQMERLKQIDLQGKERLL